MTWMGSESWNTWTNMLQLLLCQECLCKKKKGFPHDMLLCIDTCMSLPIVLSQHKLVLVNNWSYLASKAPYANTQFQWYTPLSNVLVGECSRDPSGQWLHNVVKLLIEKMCHFVRVIVYTCGCSDMSLGPWMDWHIRADQDLSRWFSGYFCFFCTFKAPAERVKCTCLFRDGSTSGSLLS